MCTYIQTPGQSSGGADSPCPEGRGAWGGPSPPRVCPQAPRLTSRSEVWAPRALGLGGWCSPPDSWAWRGQPAPKDQVRGAHSLAPPPPASSRLRADSSAQYPSRCTQASWVSSALSERVSQGDWSFLPVLHPTGTFEETYKA